MAVNTSGYIDGSQERAVTNAGDKSTDYMAEMERITSKPELTQADLARLQILATKLQMAGQAAQLISSTARGNQRAYLSPQ